MHCGRQNTIFAVCSAIWLTLAVEFVPGAHVWLGVRRQIICARKISLSSVNERDIPLVFGHVLKR